MYYRTAGNSVAAHETTAANDSAGRGALSVLVYLLFFANEKARRRNQVATILSNSLGCPTHVDFTDCKASLLIRVTNLRKRIRSTRQQKTKTNSAAQKKEQQASAAKAAPRRVGRRWQTAINLGSLGDSAQLSRGEATCKRFDNRAAERARWTVKSVMVTDELRGTGESTEFMRLHQIAE